MPDQGTNGILPNMILNQGFPNYPIPPFIDPSFANKDNIPWWQGRETLPQLPLLGQGRETLPQQRETLPPRAERL